MSADSNTVFRLVEEPMQSRSRKETMKPLNAAVRFSIFALAIGLTIFSAQVGYAQEHRAVNLSNARGLPYSDGVVAGNTLYIAGQEG